MLQLQLHLQLLTSETFMIKFFDNVFLAATRLMDLFQEFYESSTNIGSE